MEPRKPPIRRSDVLMLVSQEAIMEKYTGIRLTLNKFLSPFRHEKKPSCNFYYIGDTLMFRDRGSYDHGDCFFVAKKVLGSDNLYGKIYEDFKDRKSPTHHHLDKRADKLPKLAKSGTLSIDVTYRPWDGVDEAYWLGRYGIDKETRKLYGIKPIAIAWFNSPDYSYHIRSTPADPMYGYQMGEGIWKLYRPLTSTLGKWKNNYGSTPNLVIEGDSQRQGSRILIIQKALKENAYLYQHHKIDSVSSPSETSMINEESMRKYLAYYDKVYVMLDNDRAGQEGNQRYIDKYGIEPILLPSGIKNITDFHQTNPNEALLWMKERLNL